MKLEDAVPYFRDTDSEITLRNQFGIVRGPRQLPAPFSRGSCGISTIMANNKLKIAPIGGGFIVTEWSNIKDNYALVYMPEIAYKATVNSEITLSTVIFDGKGDNLFANLKDYNMLMFKLKYSF